MRTKFLRARRHSRLLAFAFAALASVGALSGGGASAAQEPGGRKEAETPLATVRGRVVYEGTDKPVRRARIMLVSFEQRGGERGGLTDARGEFRIADVTAGTYFAVIDVPGVVSPVAYIRLEDARAGPLAYNAVRKEFEEIVVEGEGEVEVTVRARRGGAVSGRVTYADGEPAVNVDVHVMRREPRGLVKVLTGINIGALASLRTDDRGAYRVAGLPPGEYVVAVSERAAHGDETNVREDDMMLRGGFETLLSPQFLTTFYPSATAVKEAEAVRVDAGEEREGVDITIAERALRTIAGLVRGRHDKRPLAGAKVVIFARADYDRQADLPGLPEMARNSVGTDAEGRWALREIPDGDYTLVVSPPDRVVERPIPVGDPAAAAATVVRPKQFAPLRHDLSVSSDVSELVVELGEGARISGNVVVEGLKELPERTYAYVYVRATPVGERGGAQPSAEGSVASAGLPAGGPFVVEGLQPGRFVLRSDVNGAEDTGLYVKSVTWRGRDLQRAPLELSEGESVEGVTVVVTRGEATLNLSALDRERKPERYLNVLLAPSDPSAAAAYGWKTLCTTDAAGACSVKAAPGEYMLIPLLPGEMATFEELVKLKAATATRVVLLPGETKSFELVVR